jgi:hypothetical protein
MSKRKKKVQRVNKQNFNENFGECVSESAYSKIKDIILPLFCLYCVFFLMLPFAYLIKDTKDIILKTEPKHDLAIGYFNCNFMDVAIAQTVEENVAFAKDDAKEQLERIAKAFPVCVVWLFIIELIARKEERTMNIRGMPI